MAVSNGLTAGSWASSGGIGTFSGVNADNYRDNGSVIRQIYSGKTRLERHEELIDLELRGYKLAQIAPNLRGKGRLNVNILWEMGGAQESGGEFQKSKGLVHGVTCGAGMPFKFGEIASRFDVFYYPIVSSARAFKILFLRAYKSFLPKLGAVVYEDPWLAGEHNGLSNVNLKNQKSLMKELVYLENL